MLYRFFPFDPEADPKEDGGALFVPRSLQGAGRHDAPDAYGALYLSRDRPSVVAEYLQRFQRQSVERGDLEWAPGRPYGIAAMDDAGLDLLDLDEPRNLVARALRPSRVATRVRKVTRQWARVLYDEGVPGFEWWSTIEASWINATLFADRTVGSLAVVGEPEALHVDHPAVREAAAVVGVTLP